MVASGIRLSNLRVEVRISQGHQPVLASSTLRGGEVETCFISIIAQVFGNTSTRSDYKIDQFWQKLGDIGWFEANRGAAREGTGTAPTKIGTTSNKTLELSR